MESELRKYLKYGAKTKLEYKNPKIIIILKLNLNK